MTTIWPCLLPRWTSGSPDDRCDWHPIHGAGADEGDPLKAAAPAVRRRIPPSVPVPAPVGWSPQTAIVRRFPEIARLGQAAQQEIRVTEARLDRWEAAGDDAFRLRQVVRELRWRLE